jgi:AcrR family transcriptional regulator
MTDSYHHGDLREALLDAALALEPGHGPMGVSLREAAGKVGVTHPAAYHHFASKEALLFAVAHRGFARLITALDLELARAPDAFFSIIMLGAAYVRFAFRAQSEFRFMYGTSPASAGPLTELHTAVLERFGRAVRQAQEGDLIRPRRSERWAAMFWSTAHGLATLTIAGALDGAPRSKPARRTVSQRERRTLDLVRAAMVALIFGMKPPDSTWAPRPGKGV